MDLTNQHIVILGGTSGIGLATAALAAREGARVTVVSSRRSSVDRALAALPPTAAGRAADLADPVAIQALFSALGPLDHLVYTAGDALALAPVDSLDLPAARDFFTVRFFGALAAVRAALPQLNKDHGSITLTTGIAKDRPSPGWSVAASVTGAVASLTRALAVELAPLRVNAVSPGAVRTPLWDTLPTPDRDRLYRDLASALPVGRIGEPDDLARAYLSLITQPFATGTVLTVDGGGVLV